MTQCQRVLKYMNDFGTINPMQALFDLGVMRLGARIWDLRKKGWPIITHMVACKNRYGKATKFAEYRLEEKETC